MAKKPRKPKKPKRDRVNPVDPATARRRIQDLEAQLAHWRYLEQHGDDRQRRQSGNAIPKIQSQINQLRGML